MSVFGGVEAGGTKFVCAIGTGPGDLREEARFPTTTPAETLGKVVAFFRGKGVAALGVGSFGPVDLAKGSIAKTPKPGWTGADLRGALARELSVPVVVDTDVNAAALGEHTWGAAHDVDNLIYLTVGTGIGGGALVEGRLLHGLAHPEMGHVRIPNPDRVEGVCPFHGDCLEGLASGPALERRWKKRAEELAPDHPAWAEEARFLGLGVAGLLCTLSPERVVMGGGVMEVAGLIERVREQVKLVMNGYIEVPEIVLPGLGGRAGVLGAIQLAKQESP